jgi:hypothetical protein
MYWMWCTHFSGNHFVDVLFFAIFSQWLIFV